ncbi:MAG: ATP-dependent helicase [Kiritimatiellae bacterium]|nr:ATP-dependent helicase [Kiritimatiellia bacterium]
MSDFSDDYDDFDAMPSVLPPQAADAVYAPPARWGFSAAGDGTGEAHEPPAIPSPDAILSSLNPAQRAAVSAEDGPVLVIAAAGTGKTRTLVHRVAWLVASDRARTDQILLLTFTNRAAREMLERAGRLLGGGTHAVFGGTFHSVGCRLLRRWAGMLPGGHFDSHFTILDQGDAEKMVKSAMAILGLKPPKRGGGKKALLRFAAGGTEPEEPEWPLQASSALTLFSLAAAREAPLEEVARERYPEEVLDCAKLEALHAEYEAQKQAANAMDFDDLLSKALWLVRNCPAAAMACRGRYRYVLVDEYQDTNVVQAAFARELAAGTGNLFVVGDDFQSIYGWRGADVGNILGFREAFAEAGREVQVHFLEENYRSRPGIIDLANAVVARAHGQFEKNLRSTRGEERGGSVFRAEPVDGGHQARFVAGEIARLVREEGVPPGEIAVLYRTHYLSMEVQMELKRAGIGYEMVSGTRFFEQAHVKDLVSLPLFLVNPRDIANFSRFLQLLPGVGEKRVDKVFAALGGKADVATAAGREAVAKLLPQAARPVWEGLWRAMLEGDGGEKAFFARPDVMMERFKSAYYERFLKAEYPDAWQSRVEDLDELVKYAARYASPEQFLSEMALMTNVDGAAAQGGAGVRLTTIHQAKGLEWKAVFLIWATDGILPNARAETEGNEAEERRLFYVAVTRARDRLYLCLPKTRTVRGAGGMSQTFCEPTRYLDGVDRSLLKKVDTWDTQFVSRASPFPKRNF